METRYAVKSKFEVVWQNLVCPVVKARSKPFSIMIKPVKMAVALVVLYSRTDAFGETDRGQCLTVGQCYDVKHTDDDLSFPQGLDLNTREFEVPVIDVAALMAPQLYSTTQWNYTAATVARACEDWGFFQVTEY